MKNNPKNQQAEKCNCHCHDGACNCPGACMDKRGCRHCQPSEEKESKSAQEGWEMEADRLFENLLREYTKAGGTIPYEGSYPSPFQKARNDITAFISKTLKQEREALREKSNVILKDLLGYITYSEIIDEFNKRFALLDTQEERSR